MIDLQESGYTFNSKEEIDKVLANLFAQYQNFKIVDYNPQNATTERLKTAMKSVEQILNKRNIPFNYREKMQFVLKELLIQTKKVEQNQKLIDEMQAWAEGEFDNAENTNMLTFGEEKDEKREIISGIGKNIITPENSFVDSRDPNYLQQKLRESGFQIYIVTAEKKTKFEVRYTNNYQKNKQKNEKNKRLTEGELEFTNPEMVAKAENN